MREIGLEPKLNLDCPKIVVVVSLASKLLEKDAVQIEAPLKPLKRHNDMEGFRLPQTPPAESAASRPSIFYKNKKTRYFPFLRTRV